MEGDWPDCFIINQYVKSRLDPSLSARRVLSNFRRWPTWMWANEEMIDLVEWLKVQNDQEPERSKVGLHRVSPDHKLLIFAPHFASDEMLEDRGHRAIGVVYHPEGEHRGNYVPTILPRRYDALIYLDQTHALRPLHLKPLHDGDMAETYPSAM